MAMTLLLVIGFASVTGYAGLSTALGAFLAGVLLSETEYRHQIEIDVAPFKGLLVGLFFITVGMSIDVRVVWAAIGPILLMVAVLLVVKAAILFAACRLFGVALGVTVEAAILLAQAGEFAFIVIALGRLPGSFPRIRAGGDRGRRHQHDAHAAPGGRRAHARRPYSANRASRPHADGRQAEHTDHVIIGGYGRVGQVIGRLLKAENVPFVALDTNAELASEGASAARPCSSATPPGANSCAAPAPPGRALSW